MAGSQADDGTIRSVDFGAGKIGYAVVCAVPDWPFDGVGPAPGDLGRNADAYLAASRFGQSRS
jgi:hypothetical protein